MTTNTTKTVLFAGLLAALIIPLAGMQEADAVMGNPVYDGISTGLEVTWNGSVPHSSSQNSYGTYSDVCGHSFTAAGFYDTVSNKRGASHAVPSQINGLCNIDAEISGYVNLTLEKVVYTLTGDGNTTILNYDMGSGSSNYKFWYDATSNSGTEYVTVKAIYKHTT